MSYSIWLCSASSDEAVLLRKKKSFASLRRNLELVHFIRYRQTETKAKHDHGGRSGGTVIVGGGADYCGGFIGGLRSGGLDAGPVVPVLPPALAGGAAGGGVVGFGLRPPGFITLASCAAGEPGGTTGLRGGGAEPPAPAAGSAA
jgi:hypothetical protein